MTTRYHGHHTFQQLNRAKIYCKLEILSRSAAALVAKRHAVPIAGNLRTSGSQSMRVEKYPSKPTPVPRVCGSRNPCWAPDGASDQRLKLPGSLAGQSCYIRSRPPADRQNRVRAGVNNNTRSSQEPKSQARAFFPRLIYYSLISFLSSYSIRPGNHPQPAHSAFSRSPITRPHAVLASTIPIYPPREKTRGRSSSVLGCLVGNW